MLPLVRAGQKLVKADSSGVAGRLPFPIPAGMWNFLERVYFQLPGTSSEAVVVFSILVRVPKLSGLEEFSAQGQILKESFLGLWVLQWSPLPFAGVEANSVRAGEGGEPGCRMILFGFCVSGTFR